MFRKLISFCFACLLVSPVLAQHEALDIADDQLKKPLTISLAGDEEEEEAVELKRKRKKNVFYGIKAKKYITKSGVGDRAVFETFYYLREPIEVDEYVRDIFWYDFESRKIKNNRNINLQKGVVLHGPYEKFRADGTILEKGIFYKGTKHGRWVTYDSKNILQDKRKYYKGWPKESIVTYYDQERTKLKEIIPVEFGVKEGNYYRFHDNGQIAVSGEYQNDERVNVWREFYKFRRRKKKEVQFKSNAYDDDFKTYIIKEWNDKGELVYDYNEYQRKIN